MNKLLQIPTDKFSTTGLLVLVSILLAGCAAIYIFNRMEMRKLQKRMDRNPSPTRKRSSEVERLLELDEHEQALSSN